MHFFRISIRKLRLEKCTNSSSVYPSYRFRRMSNNKRNLQIKSKEQQSWSWSLRIPMTSFLCVLQIVISTQWNCASSGLTFKIPITIGALPRNAAHLYHNEIELQKFLQLSSVINSQPVQINNGLPKPEMHLW